MLKPLLFVSAVVLFGFTALSTPGSISQSTTPSAGQKNAAKAATAEARAAADKAQARAKEIYGIDCAICHGDSGNGKTDLAKDMGLSLKDWSNPATLADRPDQDLFTIIRNGKGDKMPPEAEGRAKDEEVWNLIIYIRNLYKLPPPPAPVPAPAPADAPAPAPPPSN
ncbi:MAG: cytochrome c [Terracidiphilus sp.]|jgi:mono/diheme cytochrome c family protein